VTESAGDDRTTKILKDLRGEVGAFAGESGKGVAHVPHRLLSRHRGSVIAKAPWKSHGGTRATVLQ